MEGDKRSMALAPAGTIPGNQRIWGYDILRFVHNNKHMTSKGVIPLKWEPTHSLLEEGPDSSDPEARSE